MVDKLIFKSSIDYKSSQRIKIELFKLTKQVTTGNDNDYENKGSY